MSIPHFSIGNIVNQTHEVFLKGFHIHNLKVKPIIFDNSQCC